jgi:fluoride exporter
MQWVAVAIGGAIGAMGRFALTAYLYPVLGNRFPLGTLVANVVGCFLVGICYVLIVERGVLPPEWRLWLIAGFLGALTTFSTFSLDAVLLWQNGHGVTALLYVLSTFVGCLVAVVLAITLTQKLV